MVRNREECEWLRKMNRVKYSKVFSAINSVPTGRETLKVGVGREFILRNENILLYILL